MRSKHSYLVYLVILFLLSACENHEPLPPQAVISIDNLEGETTDIFHFSGINSRNPNPRSKLYFRWNFGEDSTWNTLPSNNSVQSFRYLKPGNYNVSLLAINSEGLKDLTQVQITVIQGSSKPRADFEIIPEKGNIFTEFTFDASSTKDDEDSLSALQFRWDFNSDGMWDSDYSSNPTIRHQFKKQNQYKVKLEVKDHGGLKAQKQETLAVGLTDFDLKVDFSWLPENGTEQDTFLFDASASHHPDYPDMKLRYMWRLEEGEGWSDTLDEPYIFHKYRTVRSQNVRLVVIEPNGINNTIDKEIHLNPANKPPKAHFILSIPNGNIKTQFYMSSWTSSDHEDRPIQLLVRWDFEGDGNWDTNYSLEKNMYHQYPEAGEYNLTLEVKDQGGLTNTYVEPVTVSPYSNETGMVIDGRDGQIYGTVKIGNQWWLAENLRYNLPRKMYWDDGGSLSRDPWRPWICLEEYQPYCDLYGKFYHTTSVIDNTHLLGPEVDYTICPKGWRLPHEEEIKELVAYVGPENGCTRLAQGGDTDFNLQYLGYIDWEVTWIRMGVPDDTIYTPKETYNEAWLFSMDEADDRYRVDNYTIKLRRLSNDIWSGYETAKGYFIPVRCIKEDEE